MIVEKGNPVFLQVQFQVNKTWLEKGNIRRSQYCNLQTELISKSVDIFFLLKSINLVDCLILYLKFISSLS